MKPISLTIEAFGPYRDSVTLDFNELQNNSMFLISGPTGAGKTSILDAMVYALYGEPSGEVLKTDAIRSYFAEPQHMTRVDFSFAIGDAQYRVERLPDVYKRQTPHSPSPEVSLFFICLTAVGVYGGMGVWWTMPTTFLSGAAAAVSYTHLKLN